MKPGHGSQTAVIVCAGRALAHGRTDVARFSDPTALALLPEETRQSVERARRGARPASFREGLARGATLHRSNMMVARTVAIDDALREHAAPQVVILGAGLDGRAWRMPELRDAIVFEVDHPDSQRDKRGRVGSLTQASREVRFVPVDFTRGSLAEALESAGHDPTRATTWLWEGVVMYLSPSDIEATLAVVARRSAAGGRLVIAYHAPSPMLWLVGAFVRRVGEPLRSSFTAEQMRDVLARHGFRVVRDQDVATVGASLSAAVARSTKRMKHLRLVVADRS